MNLPKAEEILTQISTEGTDLNKQYIRWRNLGITETILTAMILVNTPDRCASELATPSSGENANATLLGFISGRARTLTDLQVLDELNRKSAKDPEETFTASNEEQE